MSANFIASRVDQINELIERPQLAAAMIECTLRGVGHEVTVDPSRLMVTSKCVHETTGSRKLSDLICGIVFPHENADELFHYTDMKAFRGIAADGKLRLTQLSKRLDDNEIRAGAEQHVWDGFKGVYSEELARDLFYTSFTRTTADNEGLMWRRFGDNGWGVRLRFGVEVDRSGVHRGELRGLRYFNGAKTVLNLIDDDLAAAGLPRFLPWSASRVTAFGLPEDYEWESEVRLMIKHHKSAPNRRKNEGGYDFWEVPINLDNDVASVRLIGIEAGRHADLAMVGQIVQSSPFADIVPTTAP